MRKLIIVWILAMVALVPVVMAMDLEGYVDEPTTISTACIWNGEMINNLTVIIRIYDSAGVEVVPLSNMTGTGNGTYIYTHVFNITGSYTTRETCDFDGILADGSTQIDIVKRPFGNIQVIPQGVRQADLNSTITSEWLLLLPNSTNSTFNSSLVVTGGACEVFDLSGVNMNASMTTTTGNDYLATSFMANSTQGFAEDANYAVLCNITMSQGLFVNGIKNYVYVNPHVSFWQFFEDIVLAIFGLQTTANETLNITNQTLQIIQAMNITLTNGTIGTAANSIRAVTHG